VEKDLQAIVDEATQKLDSVTNRPDWDKVKATILGPNGSLTQLGKGIGKLAKEIDLFLVSNLTVPKNILKKFLNLPSPSLKKKKIYKF